LAWDDFSFLSLYFEIHRVGVVAVIRTVLPASARKLSVFFTVQSASKQVGNMFTCICGFFASPCMWKSSRP